MKRSVLLLIVAVLIFSLSACGDPVGEGREESIYVRLGSGAIGSSYTEWQIDLLAADGVTEYVCSGEYTLSKNGKRGDVFSVEPEESITYVNGYASDRGFVSIIAKSGERLVGYSIVKFETDLRVFGKKYCMSASIVKTRSFTEDESPAITKEQVDSLIAAEIRAENKRDQRTVSFHRWSVALSWNPNMIRFLEIDGVTEYSWQLVKVDGLKVENVTEKKTQYPGDEIGCYHQVLNSEGAYMTVIVKNGEAIVGYTVVKFVDAVKTAYVPIIKKSVIFTDDELGVGVTPEQVGVMINTALLG